MNVFRVALWISLTILVGRVVWMVPALAWHAATAACPLPDEAAAVRSEAASATIIDVSPVMHATELASLVHLAPGEHVVAVGDFKVDSDLAAGTVVGASHLATGEFLDLTVSGTTATRRVLLLMH